jgi:hypothetical protein
MGTIKISAQKQNFSIDLLSDGKRKNVYILASQTYESEYEFINRLVRKICFAQVSTGVNIYENILFYSDYSYEDVEVFDEEIIKLFEYKDALNIYVTTTGVILLWTDLNSKCDKKVLYSTIDMNNFNPTNEEMKEFLEKYTIIKIYEKKGVDYLKVLEIESGEIKTFKLESIINLSHTVTSSAQLKLVPMQ